MKLDPILGVFKGEWGGGGGGGDLKSGILSLLFRFVSIDWSEG